jgi:hypothetical protein
VARNEDRASRGALQKLGEREHHDGNALVVRALAKKLISDAVVAVVHRERRDPLVDFALDATSPFGRRHGWIFQQPEPPVQDPSERGIGAALLICEDCGALVDKKKRGRLKLRLLRLREAVARGDRFGLARRYLFPTSGTQYRPGLLSSKRR